MKLAATVIYVDGVPEVLDFYRRALGVEPRFVDLDALGNPSPACGASRGPFLASVVRCPIEARSRGRAPLDALLAP